MEDAFIYCVYIEMQIKAKRQLVFGVSWSETVREKRSRARTARQSARLEAGLVNRLSLVRHRCFHSRVQPAQF
ncbi:hypothetical protein Btru_060489 [Bulinus truncatus]|nr:hypothetical protein Btru_060489 [Bulinus truncatus]